MVFITGTGTVPYQKKLADTVKSLRKDVIRVFHNSIASLAKSSKELQHNPAT